MEFEDKNENGAIENQQVTEVKQNKKQSKEFFLLRNVVLFVLGVSMVILAYVILNRPSPQDAPLPALPPINMDFKQTEADVQRIYNESVEPAIASCATRNNEAANRSVQLIKDRFKGFHNGVEPFVDDIASWGTRFGILGRMASDKWDQWWNKNENAQGVSTYVNEKFRRYIMSEEDLQTTITDAITAYSTDVLANRNQMLSEIHAEFTSSNIPIMFKMDDNEFKVFAAEVSQQISEKAKTMGQDSACSMIITLVGSEIAAYAAQKIAVVTAPLITTAATTIASSAVSATGTSTAAALVPKVAASAGSAIMTGVAMRCIVPTTALAGGGALGGATVGGGTVGSFGGPVGTIVGLGIGIVIGGIVDWWMTENFKENMTSEIDKYLDSIEKLIIEGKSASGEVTQLASTSNEKGLRSVLRDANEVVDKSFRELILKTMMEKIGK